MSLLRLLLAPDTACSSNVKTGLISFIALSHSDNSSSKCRAIVLHRPLDQQAFKLLPLLGSGMEKSEISLYFTMIAASALAPAIIGQRPDRNIELAANEIAASGALFICQYKSGKTQDAKLQGDAQLAVCSIMSLVEILWGK